MKTIKRLLVLTIALVMVLSTMSFASFATDEEQSTWLTGKSNTFVIENQDEGYQYQITKIFTGKPYKVTNTESGETRYGLADVEWDTNTPETIKEAFYAYYDLTSEDEQTAENVANRLLNYNGTDLIADIYSKLLNDEDFEDLASDFIDDINVGQPLVRRTGREYIPEYFIVDGEQKYGYGIENLSPGYYIVKNTNDANLEEGKAFGDSIAVVIGEDTIVAPKIESISSEKKVKDKDESLSSTLSNLQDHADYDIGDEIPYELTVTLPDNIGNFQTKGYKLNFVDVMSKGLSWDGKATVSYVRKNETEEIELIDDEDLDDEDPLFTNYPPGADGSTEWKLEINDIFDENNDLNKHEWSGGEKIIIRYNAVLNENAVISVDGNKNTFYVEYTNDLYNDQVFGETPEDENTVFTYEVVFIKTDDSQPPKLLKGANFKLEKYIKSTDQWVDVTALHTGDDARNPVKITRAATLGGDNNEIPSVIKEKIKTKYELDNDATDQEIREKIIEQTLLNTQYQSEIQDLINLISATEDEDSKSAAQQLLNEYYDATFIFTGLDEGKYRLSEDSVPAGYNEMNKIVFEIRPSINDVNSSPNPCDPGKVTALAGDNDNIETPQPFDFEMARGYDATESMLWRDIPNTKAPLLPTTGGIGTIIFYVLGTILLVGGGILLVARKRAERQER